MATKLMTKEELLILANAVREQCRHAATVAELHGLTPGEAVQSVDVEFFVEEAMAAGSDAESREGNR